MIALKIHVNAAEKMWFVYFLRCADNSLYAGITTSLERRLAEHNNCNKKAAKYTRVRRPVALAYAETLNNRQQASQREYQLKQLSKRHKEQLVADYLQQQAR
ncbi:putative endonuclease [Colwellia chukchiensis]|uniref:Putative endonuclease n=1 Tax=Colwellia chukchiensis TaxID=641665 RepID=A0A1H7L944_9GAMM|nr:GIY-YIG nuclease family protein [Colwellia chukchiensis]SEK94787.1 putative endonuclease [Colwellia chukchiensis]